MPFYGLERIFLLPIFPVARAVCDFSTLPVNSIPIHNASFNIEGTINSTSVRRGMSMSIGTPPQFLAWELKPSNNNSFVFSNTKWATGSTLISEDEFGVGIGGLYIENSSSTWSEKPNMLAAGASQEFDMDFGVNDTWGTDILHVNASYSINSHPIDIWTLGNRIGLAGNSTFLNSLKSSGAIASRTWSVFWGLAGFGASAQMDGVAVFGGYDKAKTTGQNMTVPLTTGTDCATNMVVTVASLFMQFPDGQSVDLQNSSSPLKYCVDPGYLMLSLHPDSIEILIANSGGTYLGISGAIYEEDNAQLFLTEGIFDGTLNFTFDTGLSITIPNNQLVVPNYNIQNNGTVTFNESERVVLASKGSRDAINVLGQPLLTASYLMVTQDAIPPALTMWQSNNNSTNDFAAIDASGNICTSSGFAGSVVQNPEDPDATSTSTGTSTPTTVNEYLSNSNGLSPGAKAGIAIGVILAALLAAGAIFFILRKKRRRGIALADRGSHSSAATELQPRDFYGGMAMKAELAGQETPGVHGSIVNDMPKTPKSEFPSKQLQILELQTYQRVPTNEPRSELE